MPCIAKTATSTLLHVLHALSYDLLIGYTILGLAVEKVISKIFPYQYMALKMHMQLGIKKLQHNTEQRLVSSLKFRSSASRPCLRHVDDMKGAPLSCSRARCRSSGEGSTRRVPSTPLLLDSQRLAKDLPQLAALHKAFSQQLSQTL